MITQERLKALFKYNPDTGEFVRIVSTSNSVRVGDISGCKRPDGYLTIYIDRGGYLSHRLAWLYVYGVMPEQIDHINGIRDDNRIKNLRDAKQIDNAKNCKRKSNNTSGYNGVYWYKAYKKWSSEIFSDGKKHHLGYFDNIDDAVKAREAANLKYGFSFRHGKD